MIGAEAGSVKAWILAFLVMAGVGIGTLVGVGCIVGANTCPGGKSHGKQASTDGAVLFQSNCALCHGVTGAGLRDAPSLISGEAIGLSLHDITYRIEHGKPLGPRGSMPRFAGVLGADQIRALANYVITLRGGTPSPSPSAGASP